jgi:hypothetical protein
MVRANISGWIFTGTMDELQIWWDNLKAKQSVDYFKGQQLKIWIADNIITDGIQTVYTYNAEPTKVYTI